MDLESVDVQQVVGKACQVLPQCLEDVLSTMFFAGVVGEIAEEDVASQVSPDTPLICVKLSFSGSIAGALLLAVPDAVAATLAADFSGCDGPSDQLGTEQSVCELANMICGSTLSRIVPDAHVVLSHPELAAEPSLPGGQTRWFELMDGVLALAFRIDRG
jgi:hypothetical protein